MALALASSTVAFQTPNMFVAPRTSVRMQMSAEAVADEPMPPPPPLIKTMMVGDGTLAGDASFDPLMSN
jgi:hypothetical protein